MRSLLFVRRAAEHAAASMPGRPGNRPAARLRGDAQGSVRSGTLRRAADGRHKGRTDVYIYSNGADKISKKYFRNFAEKRIYHEQMCV